MKKTYLYTIVILVAIILVGLISTITNVMHLPYAYAFTEGYAVLPPYGNEINPYTVNDFENDHSPNPMPYSPLGSQADYLAWKGDYIGPVPYPTPWNTICGGTGCSTDTMVPCTKHNQQYMRVEWTGVGNYCPQYIHLTNYANAVSGGIGMNYQNRVCTSSSATTATANSSTTVSLPVGNWGCYGYLRLHTYLNFGANNGTPSDAFQAISLYDGSITTTTGSTMLEPLGFSAGCGTWINHVTVSLNYLANQYDVGTGRYFSVTNITDVIIPAPETDYSHSGNVDPTIPAAFPTPNTKSLMVYYDWLVLGDYTAVTNYASPSNITVTTAFGIPANPVTGAFVGWTPIGPTQYDAAIPPTQHHIYRSLSNSLGTGPYVSVGFAPANVTFYVDTTNYGGDVYCYKVLTCNNGLTYTAVNASYHEPLLSDTIVLESCGHVAARPTFTNTPTVSPTYAGTPTMTWTPGWATATQTPIPTVDGTPDPTDAYVYPNPFNPNAVTAGYGGTGLFHVGNVQVDTKIHIYAMDGSLVKDGVYTAGSGFTWDGKNKNGSKVVSGLYYLVLEDPQRKTAVFRVIVCYKCDPVYKP